MLNICLKHVLLNIIFIKGILILFLTLKTIMNVLEQQIIILEWSLKDHVTLQLE